jgi:hypothetical protein
MRIAKKKQFQDKKRVFMSHLFYLPAGQLLKLAGKKKEDSEEDLEDLDED